MDVIAFLDDLLGQVPAWLQPVVVAAAGAVPFLEGEGGVALGVFGGLHPVLAGVAAAVGNFLAVLVVVLLGVRARRAVTSRTRPRESVSARSAARRAKFQRAYERYGVPGVSLLGPLLLPTHVTAAMLAASGVTAPRVLVWQGAAIVLWTTLTALVVTGVLVVVS